MTNEATTQTQAAPTAPKTPKTPKSYNVRLVSGQAEVLVSAYKVRDGFQVAAVQFSEPYKKGTKRSGTRGASSIATTLEAGRAAVEKIVAGLVKNGWQRPEKKAFGFARKADSFSLASLPKPPKK